MISEYSYLNYLVFPFLLTYGRLYDILPYILIDLRHNNDSRLEKNRENIGRMLSNHLAVAKPCRCNYHMLLILQQ